MQPTAARYKARSALARVAVSLTAALLAWAPVAPAAADSLDDQQREVRRRRSEVASQVDALRASDEEVEQALGALEEDVTAQRSAVEHARQAANDAQQAVERAQAAQAAVEERVSGLRTQLAAIAAEAYMGGGRLPLDPLLVDGTSPVDAARARELLSRAAAERNGIIDMLGAAEEDLGLRRAAADSALEAAKASLVDVERQLTDLEAVQSRQLEFAVGVQTRLDRALAEAAALESLDGQLASQIAQRQAAIARRVPATPGGGRTSVSGVRTTVVRGIEVSTEIAGAIDSLLAAAEADGIVLAGGGYRDPAAQIETRRRNCGSSDYEIYEMPSSQCSPPTARPGMSMHERGLAIDFTYGGSVIGSRGSPAFQWLASNAGRFGLRNLPEEPWHWSTNGN